MVLHHDIFLKVIQLDGQEHLTGKLIGGFLKVVGQCGAPWGSFSIFYVALHLNQAPAVGSGAFTLYRDHQGPVPLLPRHRRDALHAARAWTEMDRQGANAGILVPWRAEDEAQPQERQPERMMTIADDL